MANIDCSSEMSGFHRTEVALSQLQQGDMRKRRDAGRTRLENGLKLKDHPQPRNVVSQGSYQMRTMVQDDDCDYDIDDGVYFSSEDLKDKEKDLTPRSARARICEALKWDGRLKHDAEIKRNCVRQKYPEGYHIDVPVYRVIITDNGKDNKTEHYELASGEDWIESDARKVTRWYNDIVGVLNAGESDGSQMRRITRLTKKLARSRKAWKTKTTSGICITKLVVDHFVYVEGRDDDTLRETWKAIKSALDNSLRIDHPVLNDTTLADSSDSKVQYFRDCLGESLEKLDALDDEECSDKQALAAWDNVFNTNYFSSRLSSRATKAAQSTLKPAAAVAGLTFPDRPVSPNKPAGFA